VREIIDSFTQKYGLTRAEVIAEIENIFSTMLSRWYRLEVMAFLREGYQLEAVAYSKTGGVITQKPVPITEIKGWNTIKRHIEYSLMKTALLKEVIKYKRFEKEVLWGEITARGRNGDLYVEAEIVPGERVIAICPLNRLGVHERNTARLAVGERRAFYLRQVEPVFLSNTPRLKVVVDRVSKTLVEKLLLEQLEEEEKNIKIHCVKRYVGHQSIVMTSKRLPKKAIVAVDRELKERVVVKWLS